MKKKVLSILLAVFMVFPLFGMVTTYAYESCNQEHIHELEFIYEWAIDKTRHVYIEGLGITTIEGFINALNAGFSPVQSTIVQVSEYEFAPLVWGWIQGCSNAFGHSWSDWSITRVTIIQQCVYCCPWVNQIPGFPRFESCRVRIEYMRSCQRSNCNVVERKSVEERLRCWW